MATIGQALTSPEAGWKRIDDQDSNIIYTGHGVQIQGPAWATTLSYCLTASFKFYGTKFRLLGASVADTYHNGSITVTIDGVVAGTYSQYAASVQPRLDYEKTNLLLGEHLVSLALTSTANSNLRLFLDAIDIDETGLFGITNLNKYLLRKNDRVFSFSGTTVTDIGVYSYENLLTLFETNGSNNPPTINTINCLEAPFDIMRYMYKGGAQKPSIGAMAVSFPKLVLANSDIPLSSIECVNSVSITAANIKIIVSVDSGITWKTWNNGWAVVNISMPENVFIEGTIPNIISSRTASDWADLLGTSTKMRFGYCFNVNSASDVANADYIALNVNMKGKWRESANTVDYYVDYPNTSTIDISILSSGDYKINY